MIKPKPILIACPILMLAALLLFALFHQDAVRQRALKQIHDHAAVVAGSLWTFETAAPKAYLTLAATANGYDRIDVRDNRGGLFLRIAGPQPTVTEAVLRSLKLIPLASLEAPILYEGRSIGTISVRWPSRAIYLYLYILFCILLILPGLWFFLKLLESKGTLESRVRERTAELEKEIEERQRTEEALRRATLVVENSPAVLFQWKAEEGWPVELVSQNVVQFGYTPEELLSGKIIFSDLIHPDDRERVGQEVQAFTLSGVDRFRQEYRIMTKEGQVRWVDDRTVVERDDQGWIRHYQGIILDITETRTLEEQLIRSQRMESIGTLAGGVAHEINNPINGIMNYAQLILDTLEKEHPAGEFSREILHETDRIARIVRNLLTFARQEKQSHSPALLKDIVASVLSLIQTVMRHDQIILEVAIPDDLPKFKCRNQQIQQVLMNLLTNARDALNERYPGFHPDKRIRVSAERIDREGRRFIRTTVEDLGMGIPPQIRERIFDPFFTTKAKETGTGLGLSISYGIVKDHGGKLTVESEPGRYTRFRLDLPVDNGWTLTDRQKDDTGKTA